MVDYDSHSEPIVERNSELDTSHGGECRRVSNACYSSRKPGHMLKDCPYMRSRENGKEKVQLNSPSEEVPRRQQFSHSRLGM